MTPTEVTVDPNPTEQRQGLTEREMKVAWRAHAGAIAWPTVALMIAILGGEFLLWSAHLSGLLPLGWAMLGATLLAYVAFTVMHEASHGNIAGGNTKMARAERIAGWLSGAVLFAPYPVFRALHLRHHAHTNHPEKDPDYWVASASPIGVFLRCGTIVPRFYAEALWGPFSKSAAGKRVRRPVIIGAVCQITAIGSLTAAGLGQSVLLLWVVPALVASSLLAFAFDWLPHHPHDVQGRFLDTRILLVPGLALAMLWQNYHLIHHLYPRVPFYRYGRCFREIRPYLESKGSRIDEHGSFGELGAPVTAVPEGA